MRFLIALIIITPTYLYGQLWERTYGGDDYDWGSSIQQTTDGGYIVFGTSSPDDNPYQYDAYLIKIDAIGDTIWSKRYFSNNNFTDYGYSVQQTSDGGFILTGRANTLGVEDLYLIKTDSLGNTIWVKGFGDIYDDMGASVQQTSDGGYIVTGTNNFAHLTLRDLYLIKTDSNGDSLWTKSIGGEGYEEGYQVHETFDNNYIVVGFTSSYGQGQTDIYLIKTNIFGDTLWTKTYGGDMHDIGFSVQQTNDNGFIITGTTNSYGNGDYDIYLVKTSGNGETQWTKTYGGIDEEMGFSVKQTVDGGYIIAGKTESFGNGGEDVYLLKTNSYGDSLWSRTFGGEFDDRGMSVQQTIDGGYIIAGVTKSFGNGDRDFYIIKTDQYGTITSTSEFSIPHSERKMVKIIDLFGRELKEPINNLPYIEVYDDGTTEKKLIVK